MEGIFNGKATGSVAEKLLACNMDLGVLRPFSVPFKKDIRDGNRILSLEDFDKLEVNEQKFYETIDKSYITVNGRAQEIATNATLRKDEWKHYDTAVVEAVQSRLVGVADLLSRNLVYRPGTGLAQTVLEYEDTNDINDADMSMDGLNPSNNDRPEYDLKYLPLPITYKDFQVNVRALNISRKTGQPLDVRMASLCGIKIADKLETILFRGTSSYTYGGGTIYGYCDHPSRNTLSIGTHWDHSAATGATILATVISMKQALINDGKFGPYVLYVPTAYEAILDNDFKANGDFTIRERILKVAGIQDVKVADKLAADNVVLVSMAVETVRMVEALPLQTIQWEEKGGMVMLFKPLTINVPQVRADQDGKCGVCHAS